MSSPTLESHSRVHTALLVYGELTKWLKDCQPEVFCEVMDVRLTSGIVNNVSALLLQAYVRAFKHVYEEQLKGLLKDSRDTLQLVRSAEVKKPGGFILNKISGSTVDIRSPVGGSLSSLSPSRGLSSISQSVADFSGSSSFTTPSQDSFRGPTYVCMT